MSFDNAYANALMNPDIAISKRPNKRGALNPGQTKMAERSEHDEQCDLILWAVANAYLCPELDDLFAIPNGGKRDVGTGKKLKAEGVRPGVPDLMLPHARRDFYGLFIEMKVGRNKPSDLQIARIERLEKSGYCVRVCYSAQSARNVIVWYLGYT